MDITRLLQITNDIWEALRSQKTRAELDQILELTDDIKNKVVKAFHVTVDAADDVAEVAIIVMEAAARIGNTVAGEQSRVIAKPIQEIRSKTDLVDLVFAEYQATWLE